MVLEWDQEAMNTQRRKMVDHLEKLKMDYTVMLMGGEVS